MADDHRPIDGSPRQEIELPFEDANGFALFRETRPKCMVEIAGRPIPVSRCTYARISFLERLIAQPTSVDICRAVSGNGSRPARASRFRRNGESGALSGVESIGGNASHYAEGQRSQA